MPHFYSVTLQKGTSISGVVYGNFSSSRSQEIVVSKGKLIELVRPDDQGRIQTVCSQEVFGLVRCMAPFRLVGASTDYLIVGSDSGSIVILEFDNRLCVFVKVHEEKFGRSGCRRIIAGEYIAVDPKGRACMISAIERQKFVYILNRDSSHKLTISSPLEASKNNVIVFSLCALDVGYENPLFACIEQQYDATVDGSTAKSFTIYEMDLGVNHVTRKYAEPLVASAHLLIPVDAGSGGGCLICCSGEIVYKKLGHPSLLCKIPSRSDVAGDCLIVSYAKHKLKDFVLILVQTEYGDLFRVDVGLSELRMTYFDTLPDRSSGMCILKSGFMFTASESGDHSLFQFLPGGPLLEPPPLVERQATHGLVSCSSKTDGTAVSFLPQYPFKNLVLFDTLSSLSPLASLLAMDPLSEQVSGGACQIFGVGGRGPSNSFLRALRFGVGVTEMASSDLPGKPSGVWTVTNSDSLFHQYIVISFTDATLVLSVGHTVTEVSDSGLLGSVKTILADRMADGSLVQVHQKGVRHVSNGSPAPVEWRPREGKQVTVAACNGKQIIAGLTGGELVYLELQEDGLLVEVAKRDLGRNSISFEFTSVCIELVPVNRSRALWMAVAATDKSVRVLSLEPSSEKLLKQVSAQAFEVEAESVEICQNFLSIGLANGTLVRCFMDGLSGKLSDARWRFLGVRPVRLAKVKVSSESGYSSASSGGTSGGYSSHYGLIAMSSRPWLVDPITVSSGLAPLSYTHTTETAIESPVVLEYAASFHSEQCPNGYVAVSRSMLKIFTCDTKNVFSEKKMSLEFTPRKLFVLPPISNVGSSIYVKTRAMLVTVESEKGGMGKAEKLKLVAELEKCNGAANLGLSENPHIGANPLSGSYGSCVRIIDPLDLSEVAKIEFNQKECAVAACVTFFYQLKDNRPCLVVASVEDMHDASATRSLLRTYLYDENFAPQLVHATPTSETPDDGVPLALCNYEGRVLVSFAENKVNGMATLRLYELGKRRLLKKTEYRNSIIGGFVSIQVVNDRIFAADMHRSVHVLKLNRADGQIHVICDDTTQRYMSCMHVLDYNTIIGGDKFDNLFCLRIPNEIREQQTSTTGESILGSGSGLRLGPDTAYILDKTPKLELMNSFHLGDIPTSMQKVSMSSGAAEVIMYSTLGGAIGVLYPFPTEKEYELFLSLEMILKNEMGTSIVGRDHAAYRGYYIPVKAVIDGDFIRQQFMMSQNKSDIANKLGKSVNEIQKMIEEIQNRIT